MKGCSKSGRKRVGSDHSRLSLHKSHSVSRRKDGRHSLHPSREPDIRRRNRVGSKLPIKILKRGLFRKAGNTLQKPGSDSINHANQADLTEAGSTRDKIQDLQKSPILSHIDVALSQRQRSLSGVTLYHRFELTVPGTRLFISDAHFGPIEILFPRNALIDQDLQPEQTETLGIGKSHFQAFIPGVEWNNPKL